MYYFLKLNFIAEFNEAMAERIYQIILFRQAYGYSSIFNFIYFWWLSTQLYLFMVIELREKYSNTLSIIFLSSLL